MAAFPFPAGARFDVVVVGGGIIGAGVARDAALRGLSVALAEQSDFGSGTTAGSTRLIHGGLRYLEMLDFRLVRMDLRERETLLRIAPHLVKPLEFLVPFYDRSLFYRAQLRVGMRLYDALSYDRSLPGHRFLGARETLAAEPRLCERGLQGAAAYFDAQVNSPERLCLENIVDARRHGAVPLNYTTVTGAVCAGDGAWTVRLRHTRTGADTTLRARVVVNASGPWFDRVATSLAPHPGPLIRTTKGIHVAAASASRSAVVLFAGDGRLFFVIPWLGYSWIGTTDTDFADDPARARATPEDVAYLLHAASPFFPCLRTGEVYWSNAGVRALVRKPGKESSVSRLHRIVDGADAGAPGLISIAGGKITGYRAIAEEAVDLVCRKLGSEAKCRTAAESLPGALAAPAGRAPSHLESLYGARADEVESLAREDPALAQPLAPDSPDVAAQVIHAVRQEHCVRLADFLLRRTLLGFRPDQGVKTMLAVAPLMAAELGWTALETAAEIEHYRTWVAESQAFRDGAGSAAGPRPESPRDPSAGAPTASSDTGGPSAGA